MFRKYLVVFLTLVFLASAISFFVLARDEEKTVVVKEKAELKAEPPPPVFEHHAEDKAHQP